MLGSLVYACLFEVIVVIVFQVCANRLICVKDCMC